MRKSVIANKPISYVLGKHTEDEEVENVEVLGSPQVDVKVFVEKTEYLESNPTGDFNLSITQKQKKVGSYQQVSYQQHMLNKEALHNQALKRQQEKTEEDEVDSEFEEVIGEFQKEEPVDFMFWNANKKEGSTLLRINVRCNAELEFGDKMKASVRIIQADGVKVPLSFVSKDNVDGINWTLIGHFELENPGTKVDFVKLEVVTELIQAPKYKTTVTVNSTGT